MKILKTLLNVEFVMCLNLNLNFEFEFVMTKQDNENFKS